MAGIRNYGRLKLYQLMALAKAYERIEYYRSRDRWEAVRALASAVVNFSQADAKSKKKFLNNLDKVIDSDSGEQEEDNRTEEQKAKDLLALSDQLHGKTL